MYCSNCGKKLNKDGKCSNCEKLKNEKINNNQNKEVQNNKELSNVLGIVTIVSAFFINIFIRFYFDRNNLIFILIF